jgi:hypothetical protein
MTILWWWQFLQCRQRTCEMLHARMDTADPSAWTTTSPAEVYGKCLSIAKHLNDKFFKRHGSFLDERARNFLLPT